MERELRKTSRTPPDPRRVQLVADELAASMATQSARESDRASSPKPSTSAPEDVRDAVQRLFTIRRDIPSLAHRPELQKRLQEAGLFEIQRDRLFNKLSNYLSVGTLQSVVSYVEELYAVRCLCMPDVVIVP